MSITKEEITDLALRYLSAEEITDFPMNNDLFCLLMRPVPTDRILKEEEGWVFGGYGICNGYMFDEEAKPRGKWLWMHFASLSSFPPVEQVLKLQPPHVVKGRFQSADRSHEIRIIKIAIGSHEIVTADQRMQLEKSAEKQSSTVSDTKNNIVAFRQKGRKPENNDA
jgi:hypothetical protein